MKKDEIKIGEAYLAKVTNRIVPVKITRENPHGGWDAINTATGKAIRIKSAARLRKKVAFSEVEVVAAAAMSAENAKAKATPQIEAPAGSTPLGIDKQAKPAITVVGGPKKISLIKYAAAILAETKTPMKCKTIVEKAIAAGWTTSGKTPHATLNAAMIREIAKKGDDSRFKKVERGLFTAA